MWLLLTLETHRNFIWVTKLVEELVRIADVEEVRIVAMEDFLHESRLDWLLTDCRGIINRVSDAADATTVKRCLAILTSARLFGIPVFNGPLAYSMCSNKWCHHSVFLRAGLASPSTAVVMKNRLSPKERMATISQRLLRDPLPHLIKPNSGGFGAGIVKILEDPDADDPVLPADDTLILQSYVPPLDGKIYRVWFLLGRVVCAVERWSTVGSDEFTTGCAGSALCTRGAIHMTPPKISAWPVPVDICEEIERMLGYLCDDAHAGSVEFLVNAAGQRLYFDLNLLSTLPLDVTNADKIWGDDYNPWRELAEAVVMVLKRK